MQRLCITLCGLLSSCLCSWGSIVPFSVSQSPSAVMLSEGDQIEITCSWNISTTGLKVRWFKGSQTVTFNQTNKFTKTATNNGERLVINNTDVNDTGLYICEVTNDIPLLVKVKGTGTDVTYQRKNGSAACSTPLSTTTALQKPAEPSVTALGASVSGAVVILSICVCLSVWRMKRGCGQSERRVIREGPPSEGEEPGNSEDGESSRTSRGSTQWYMVPVYESYFDLQKSDDQQCADSDKAACASALTS